MIKFLSKHKFKFLFLMLVICLIPVLTSCRMDGGNWYAKPYTTYGKEWTDLWNGGSGFWNTLFGWPINILSWPIAKMCSAIGKGLGGSYFWGIFFTTIIVRTLAWPVYSKQNGMSLKMQLMQPEMAKVQAKYKGRQDPRSQQQMQQEMMQLYKKYKVNPLGCITTMLLQFPIFMSMYEVVQRINATSTTVVGNTGVVVAGEFALANTKLFNFYDLTTSFFDATNIHDRLFGLFIALAFGGITFLQQKLAQRPMKYQKQYPNDKANKQKTQQQNQMKWMMIIMNVMFIFMSLRSTSLAIYWLIGGVYQIGQSQIGRLINQKRYEKAKAKESIF